MSRDFVTQPPGLRRQEVTMHSKARVGAADGGGGDAARTLLHKFSPLPPRSSGPLRVQPASVAVRDVDEYQPKVALATLAARAPAEPGLRSSPAAVHFAGVGFDGKRARALLKIVNVATVAQRVYVTPVSPELDDGAFFSVEVANAGRIAPGLAQEVVVTFAASAKAAARYHFASLRIVGETGELSVPLHAYPVSTSFSFPSRVDFGRCALTGPATRVITVSPGVPIPFDFDFSPVVRHPDFSVQPPRGVIPPGASADISVIYTPTALTTASAEFLLRTSQAHAAPQRVVLTGSAAPGLARDRRLLQALTEAEELARSAGVGVGGGSSSYRGVGGAEGVEGGVGGPGDASAPRPRGTLPPSSSSSSRRQQHQQRGVAAGGGVVMEDGELYAPHGDGGGEYDAQEHQQLDGGGGGGGDTEGGDQLSFQQQQQQQQQYDDDDGGGVSEEEPGNDDGGGLGGGNGGRAHSRSGGYSVTWGAGGGAGPAGVRTRSPESSQRGVGQRRWLKTDPGLSLLDDRLEAHKQGREAALLAALEERSAVVDAMAESLRLATGVRVGRAGAVNAVQGILRSVGKAHAPLDDYGQIPAAGQGGGSAGGKGGALAAISAAANVRIVGDSRIPLSLPLGAQKELDYVLAQKSGFTAPRDLPLKIAEARQAREAARAAQARLRSLAQDVANGQMDEEGAGGGGTSTTTAAGASARRGRQGRQGQGGESDLEHKSGATAGRSVSPPFVPRGAATAAAASGAGGGATTTTLACKSHRSLSQLASQAERRTAVLRGPGLPPATLAAAELSGSWLFPALQGVPAAGLLQILLTLAGTPDSVPLSTGTLLDEVLGAARAQLLGSTSARALPHISHVGDGLPPVLAALVRAAAAPMRRPRELREAVFENEVAELASAQKAREFAGYPWRGEQLLTSLDVARLSKLRALLRALEDAVVRRLHRTRRTTVAVPSGGLHAVHAALVAAAAAADDVGEGGDGFTSAAVGMERTLLAAAAAKTGASRKAAALRAIHGDSAEHFPILSSPVIKAAMLPVSAAVIPAGARAPFVPSFRDERTLAGDAWAIRRDAVTRFVESVTAAVVRRRVDKRLAMLERKIAGAAAAAASGSALATTAASAGMGAGSLEATRAAVAALVEAEHKRAALESEGSWVMRQPPRVDPRAPPNVRAMQEAEAARGPVLVIDIAPARITRTVLPIAPPEESADVGAAEVRGWDLRTPLSAAIPSFFCEEAPFAIAEWPEAEAMGYTPLPLPAAPTHIPRQDARPLREGALHETAATGFLPLPCAQSSLDARLAAAVGAARTVSAPAGGLGVLSEPAARLGWDGLLLEPHASVRHGPGGMVAHPATGQRAGGPTEGEPGYGLSAHSWLRVPVISLPPDASPSVLGHRHAHSFGNGLGALVPPPGIPSKLMPPGVGGAQGIRNAPAGVTTMGAADGGEDEEAAGAGGAAAMAAGGAGAAASAMAARGPRGTWLSGAAASAAGATFGGSPLDFNGVLPTQGQVLGASTGLSSLRYASAPLPLDMGGAGGGHGDSGPTPASPGRAPAAAAGSVAAASSSASSTPTLRVGAALPQTAGAGNNISVPPPASWWSHTHLPTSTRPAVDLSSRLLAERMPPRLKADGTRRLPTDVTPLEARDLFARLAPPGADPWIPSGLPALLSGPDPRDALSDDSESDPEREDAAVLRREAGEGPEFFDDDGEEGGGVDGRVRGSGGGGGGGRGRSASASPGGSPSSRAGSPRLVAFSSGPASSPSSPGAMRASRMPKRRGPAPPTLDQARGLFLPKAVARSAAAARAQASASAAAGTTTTTTTTTTRRGGGGGPDATSRLAAEGLVPAGAHSLSVRTQAPPAASPFVSTRDAAALRAARFDLAASWRGAHFMEGLLVGLPFSDAGEALSHPPRLGAGSGPGVAGVHAHGQAAQGAHVRRPRGAAGGAAAPPAAASVAGGIAADSKRALVLGPR